MVRHEKKELELKTKGRNKGKKEEIKEYLRLKVEAMQLRLWL